MLLPNATDKQKEILIFLYFFRFINTNQFQKLFNHKDKTMVKEWLKDLREKKYITKVDNEEDSFINRTKPAVYCLAIKARHLLKKNDKYNTIILDRIYREKSKKTKFVNKCLSIVDMYLFFFSQNVKGQKMEFFTESELVGYDYLPNGLSAYITITFRYKIQRYFLEVFEEDTPSHVLRNRVRAYLSYANNGNWEVNTHGEQLPAILFVCPTKNQKSHIYFFTKAKFEKTHEEIFDLYLTTWDVIKNSKKDIWERVSIEK